MRLSKADHGRDPADDGFPLKRGLFVGALAEHELHGFGSARGFNVDLGVVADRLLSRMRLDPLSPERVTDLRTTGIEWVRRWQGQFPAGDDDLDWIEVASLLAPQTDLFVRRPDRFAIRVRPDNVVGWATPWWR